GPNRRRPAPRGVRGCRNRTLTTAPRDTSAARSAAPRRAAADTAGAVTGKRWWMSAQADAHSSRVALIEGMTARASAEAAATPALRDGRAASGRWIADPVG